MIEGGTWTGCLFTNTAQVPILTEVDGGGVADPQHILHLYYTLSVSPSILYLSIFGAASRTSTTSTCAGDHEIGTWYFVLLPITSLCLESYRCCRESEKFLYSNLEFLKAKSEKTGCGRQSAHK